MPNQAVSAARIPSTPSPSPLRTPTRSVSRGSNARASISGRGSKSAWTKSAGIFDLSPLHRVRANDAAAAPPSASRRSAPSKSRGLGRRLAKPIASLGRRLRTVLGGEASRADESNDPGHIMDEDAAVEAENAVEANGAEEIKRADSAVDFEAERARLHGRQSDSCPVCTSQLEDLASYWRDVHTRVSFWGKEQAEWTLVQRLDFENPWLGAFLNDPDALGHDTDSVYDASVLFSTTDDNAAVSDAGPYRLLTTLEPDRIPWWAHDTDLHEMHRTLPSGGLMEMITGTIQRNIEARGIEPLGFANAVINFATMGVVGPAVDVEAFSDLDVRGLLADQHTRGSGVMVARNADGTVGAAIIRAYRPS